MCHFFFGKLLPPGAHNALFTPLKKCREEMWKWTATELYRPTNAFIYCLTVVMPFTIMRLFYSAPVQNKKNGNKCIRETFDRNCRNDEPNRTEQEKDEQE